MTALKAYQSHAEPLGLLLELVEAGQLAVTSISIASITRDYLDRIKRLESHDPEALSDFLQLGCRLIHIKSLALLPDVASTEQLNELKQLNIELEEYRRFQRAANELTQTGDRRTWHRPSVTKLAASELPIPSIDLQKLQEAFTRALLKATPIQPKGSISPHLSQATVTHNLLLRLKQGSFSLESVFETSTHRNEVIVTFLAVLELMKTRRIRVVQVSQYDLIGIEAINA